MNFEDLDNLIEYYGIPKDVKIFVSSWNSNDFNYVFYLSDDNILLLIDIFDNDDIKEYYNLLSYFDYYKPIKLYANGIYTFDNNQLESIKKLIINRKK